MAVDLNAFEKNQDVATVDTTKKMRVAIIGCGWIAEAHLGAYLKQPDVEIVAACDLIPGKAEAFFKKHGVEGVPTTVSTRPARSTRLRQA